MNRAVIGTDFPKAKTVAKTLGVSRARADQLSGLMDRIAKGETHRFAKKRLVRKKKK